MQRVLLEGNRVGDFAGGGPDPDIEPQGLQLTHHRPIEISHTAGLQGDPTHLTQTGLDHQLVINEIEDHLEMAATMRNG